MPFTNDRFNCSLEVKAPFKSSDKVADMTLPGSVAGKNLFCQVPSKVNAQAPLGCYTNTLGGQCQDSQYEGVSADGQTTYCCTLRK